MRVVVFTVGAAHDINIEEINTKEEIGRGELRFTTF
jgi:hypothetical protein